MLLPTTIDDDAAPASASAAAAAAAAANPNLKPALRPRAGQNGDGGTAPDERNDPVGDRRHVGGDRPEQEPGDVRDREQQPEEDGEPRPPQVVQVHEPCPAGRIGRLEVAPEEEKRVTVRIAVG